MSLHATHTTTHRLYISGLHNFFYFLNKRPALFPVPVITGYLLVCVHKLMYIYVFQVALYNTDQEGSDSPRSSLNNSLSDQSLASVNLNSVGSVHSYTAVRMSSQT